MPSVINSSTSAGVTITSDTSAILQLQTASTAAVTIDASQNVGIGTASPANKLDVVGNIRSILASSGDQTGISLTNNGTTNGRVQFSTSDGSPRYYIQANGNTSLDFVTVLAGTNYTALSISRTTNNLTFGQSNAGIVFNNSSALTNSTLNDYETGTWTPVATSSSGSISSYSSNGVYTKIGRTVIIFGSITINTVGTASGGLNFSGLPFSTLNSDQYLGVGRECIATGIIWYADVSSTTGFVQNASGGGITWTNGYSYRFTITYQAAF